MIEDLRRIQRTLGPGSLILALVFACSCSEEQRSSSVSLETASVPTSEGQAEIDSGQQPREPDEGDGIGPQKPEESDVVSEDNTAKDTAQPEVDDTSLATGEETADSSSLPPGDISIPSSCESDEQCAEGRICSEGQCVCEDECTDLECGTNECGESCGSCDAGHSCTPEGLCKKDCNTCPAKPTCLAKDFEAGDLSDWKQSSAEVVGEFDGEPAPQGKFMMKLSSSVPIEKNSGGAGDAEFESAKASFSTCAPMGSHQLRFWWRVYSEEFIEWCGEPYQDGFEVAKKGEDGVWEPVFDVSIDDLCPVNATCPDCGSLFKGLEKTELTLDLGDVYATPWIEAVANVGWWDGEEVASFRFRAKSAVDFLHHTIVLVDDIVLEECISNCDGKECGDDGCGGMCGTCDDGTICTMAGQCCTPSCEGKTCGTDGCGGVCGTCDGLETCQGGYCVSNCGDGFCDMIAGEHCENCPSDCAMGVQCPPTACDDGMIKNCAGGCSPVNWLGDGYCDPSFKCADMSWDNGDCMECTGSCDGKACGPDGCGGSCGECQAGNTCLSGLCVPCQPQCSRKECGSDGCGGTCGTCAANKVCGFDGTCGKPGCTGGIDSGCKGCPCEACTCQKDPSCCEVMWDPVCVATCTEKCGGCEPFPAP